MIEYSLGLVAGYVVAKAITPHSPRLVTKKLPHSPLDVGNNSIMRFTNSTH